MTKEEYIKSRCSACGNCDGSDYHRYHCPTIDEIDSSWEICKEEMIKKSCEFLSALPEYWDVYEEHHYTIDRDSIIETYKKNVGGEE